MTPRELPDLDDALVKAMLDAWYGAPDVDAGDEVMRRVLAVTRTHDGAAARAQIEALTAERDKWRKLELEAANHVETVICLRTDFTGDPPYVGWKGLGLALTEALDERDAMRAQIDARDERVKRLEEALRPFASWTIGGLFADDPENREKYPLLTQTILNARAALAPEAPDAD